VSPDTVQQRFRNLFLLLVVVAVSALFLFMIRSFLVTLLLAAIFAGLTRPIYLDLRRLVGGRQRLGAALALVLLILCAFGPLAAVLGIVAQQAVEVAKQAGPALRAFMSDPQWLSVQLRAIPGADRLEPLMPELAARSAELVSSIAGFLVTRASAATSGTVIFLLNFAILLYAMFFFYTEGPGYLRTLLAYLPFSDKDNERLIHRFVSVTRATLKGTLLVGVIQGTINGLAFWIVGLPAPAFWGAVMIVLSLVPLIGGALVWVPAAAWLALTGGPVRALVLVVLCGGVSGTIDNVLRPRFVGRDTRMPDLLVFVSTLGGLGLFGVVGFIVGPLVAALFLTLWEMLGVLYRSGGAAATPASAGPGDVANSQAPAAGTPKPDHLDAGRHVTSE
jgi:predicted PurR-regulated permease PerM